MTTKANPKWANFWKDSSDSDSDIEDDAEITEVFENVKTKSKPTTTPSDEKGSASHDESKPKAQKFPKGFPFDNNFFKAKTQPGKNSSPVVITQIGHAGNVHIGNTYNGCNFSNQVSLQKVAVPKPKTQSPPKVVVPETILSSKGEVTEKIIHLISTEIQNWQPLASRLGFSPGQIENITVDNHVYGVEETIISMLFKWKEENESDIGKLAAALCDTDAHNVAVKLGDLI